MSLHHRNVLLLEESVVWCSPVPDSSYSTCQSSPQTASPSVHAAVGTVRVEPGGVHRGPAAGKPVTLTIFLRGVTSSTTPVVAICESIAFRSQTVTLEPDAESMALKGTVTLEPILMSRTTVPPRAARVQVTFARSRRRNSNGSCNGSCI